MPFKSMKQQRYMFMKHPKLAKEWARKYGTLGGKKTYKRGSGVLTGSSVLKKVGAL